MHLNSFDYIIRVADNIVKEHNTRSASVLAKALDMTSRILWTGLS